MPDVCELPPDLMGHSASTGESEDGQQRSLDRPHETTLLAQPPLACVPAPCVPSSVLPCPPPPPPTPTPSALQASLLNLSVVVNLVLFGVVAVLLRRVCVAGCHVVARPGEHGGRTKVD